jgi:hypothetical protein
MTALDILRDNNLVAEGNFTYETKTLNDQFSAIEIWSKGDSPVLFREFYFIVDTTDSLVYIVDFQEPDSVFLEKIRRGIEQPYGRVKQDA